MRSDYAYHRREEHETEYRGMLHSEVLLVPVVGGQLNSPHGRDEERNAGAKEIPEVNTRIIPVAQITVSSSRAPLAYFSPCVARLPRCVT